MVSPNPQVGLITAEEFMRLPPEPEGVTRELWEGVVREFGEPLNGGNPMTSRNRFHSMAEAIITAVLVNWLEQQSAFKGVVAAGEARCRLTKSPETVVGIDVAVFGPEHLENISGRWFDGPPVLAVEILSPSDTQEAIHNKLRMYLDAGTRQVWHVDVELETVTVHRVSERPVLLHAGQLITGGIDLPGFEASVARFFPRGRSRR